MLAELETNDKSDVYYKALRLHVGCVYYARNFDTKFWYDTGKYRRTSSGGTLPGLGQKALWHENSELVVLQADGTQKTIPLVGSMQVIDESDKRYVHGIDVKRTYETGYLCFTELVPNSGVGIKLELDKNSAYDKPYHALYISEDEYKSLTTTSTLSNLIGNFNFEKVMIDRNEVDVINVPNDFYTTVVDKDGVQYVVLRSDLLRDCDTHIISAIKLLLGCEYWINNDYKNNIEALISSDECKKNELVLYRNDQCTVRLLGDGSQELEIDSLGTRSIDEENGCFVTGVDIEESVEHGYLLFTELSIRKRESKSRSSALSMLGSVFGNN